MLKPTISDTQFGKSLNLDKLIHDAVMFFSKYYDSVKLSEKDITTLKNIKNFGNRYMFGVFESIVENDKLKNFEFFDYSRLSKNGVTIPEILTISAITTDGKYLSSHIDDRLKKVWCNITPWVKKKTFETDRIEFSDIDKVQEIVVRGSLCRSYQENNRWLSTDVAAMIIESYALTIGNILSSAYKLSTVDNNIVILLFAMYYAQLFNLEGSMSNPELLIKCKKLHQLGLDMQVVETISRYRENKNEILSIKEICSILAKHGSVKLSTFTPAILYSLFSRGTTDIQIMLIALEYPPYYVIQLLRLADNYKNYTLAANPNNKKIGQAVAERLRIDSTFIPKL